MLVVSTPDSTSLEESTGPFLFPHGATGSGGTQPGDDLVLVGDWAVGARYIVEPKPPGPRVECTVVHEDCFNMYTGCAGSDQGALRYLWFFSLWRQPWDRTKTLQGIRPLPREEFLCSRSAVSYVLGKLGMLDFSSLLPWEIISNVFDFSKDAPLWKAAQAVTAALDHRQQRVDGFTLVPALEIASWKRGDAYPELLETPDKTEQLVRFTIDSQGISQVDRIEKSSPLEPKLCDTETRISCCRRRRVAIGQDNLQGQWPKLCQSYTRMLNVLYRMDERVSVYLTAILVLRLGT